MPIMYEIDATKRLVRVTADGTCTADDLFANQDALRADPAFSPDLSALIDLTRCHLPNVRSEDLRLLAQRAPYDRGSSVAIVASDDLHYGLGRMLQTFGEVRPVRVQIFRDRASALAWLGASPADS